jgi:hypothetical protein
MPAYRFLLPSLIFTGAFPFPEIREEPIFFGRKKPNKGENVNGQDSQD